MAVLGVLLILIAVVVVGAALWAGSQPGIQAPRVDFLGGSYSLHPITMLVIGAGAVLLLFLGLWLMTSAGKRRWRDHRERRDLEKQRREQEKELERTRAELAKRGETPAAGTTTRTAPAETGRERHASRHDERHVERELRPEEHVEGRGPRADGTYEQGSGLHADGGLSREEEVRRAAERRRDL